MKPSTLIGVVFAIPGAFMVFTCALDWPHCNAWIAGMGCSMLTIGALIIEPDSVKTALQSLAGVVGQYLPTNKPKE